MSRRVLFPHSLLGPGGCCDACGNPNWNMGCEGILCWKCKRGIFMHRSFWLYTFDGEEFSSAVPQPDLDAATVYAEWRRIATDLVKNRESLPEPLTESLRQIGETHWGASAESRLPGVIAK